MIFNIDNNIKPINEVYIGKTPELLAIEHQLDKFRQKYISMYLLSTGTNSDPDLLKFNRMIEMFFGFGTFCLTIISEKIPNAYTMPIDSRFDVKYSDDDFIIDKNGYRFKKEADYAGCVWIYTGILFNPAFTTAECFALILHEIGHNFFKCMTKQNGALSGVYKLFVALLIIKNTINNLIRGRVFKAIGNSLEFITNNNEYIKMSNEIKKNLRQNKNLYITFIDYVSDISGVISTVKLNISSLNRVLSLGNSMWLNAPYIMFNMVCAPLFPLTSISYKNELTADNFATIYGYGAELSSALEKLSESKYANTNAIMRIADNVPILSTLIHLNELIPLIIIKSFDEHPESVNRCIDQLNLLKHEAAKADIDPKMRQVILSDIAACEKQINKFTKTKITNPYICQKIYNNFLIHINGGLRNIILNQDEKRFNDYDDQYNKHKI